MNIPPTSQLARILKARAANPTNPPVPQPLQPAPKATVPGPNVTEIPYRLKRLEPTEPPAIINEDPVFDTLDAAAYLGVLPSRLQKWRQRDQGPDYLRYPGNDIRYELSSLAIYRVARRVRPSSQPNPGRRAAR
jgi:hypothetical protein